MPQAEEDAPARAADQRDPVVPGPQRTRPGATVAQAVRRQPNPPPLRGEHSPGLDRRTIQAAEGQVSVPVDRCAGPTERPVSEDDRRGALPVRPVPAGR